MYFLLCISIILTNKKYYASKNYTDILILAYSIYYIFITVYNLQYTLYYSILYTVSIQHLRAYIIWYSYAQYYIYIYMHLSWLSHSVVSRLFAIPLSPARLLQPRNFPGTNTAVGCRFPTPGDLPHTGDRTHVSCISPVLAGRFSTSRHIGSPYNMYRYAYIYI